MANPLNLPMVARSLRNLVSRPATRRYPTVVRPPFPGARGTLEFDLDSCVLCGLCVRRCPTVALTCNRDERLLRDRAAPLHRLRRVRGRLQQAQPQPVAEPAAGPRQRRDRRRRTPARLRGVAQARSRTRSPHAAAAGGPRIDRPRAGLNPAPIQQEGDFDGQHDPGQRVHRLRGVRARVPERRDQRRRTTPSSSTRTCATSARRPAVTLPARPSARSTPIVAA